MLEKQKVCYRCGESMFDAKYYEKNKDQFDKEPKLTHVEHIIHNALFGRLKSNNILCKTCGAEFGKDEDKEFVSLFFPITERIKHLSIPKDHGKASVNSVKGTLYDDENLQTAKDVYLRNQKVTPLEPFYEFDPTNNRVIIYSSTKRGKQYQNIVKKELGSNGYDINKLTFEIQEDISDKGILGVHFTEGIENFNDRFKPGFVKIAVGYAIHCGVDREQLPKVLSIDSSGIGNLIFEKNIIPFIPIGPTDRIYETNRNKVEEYYPTHTCILFSQKVGEKNYLFCYIDLFSTFQYYVLLNDKYKGRELYKPFYQTVVKREKPNIDVRRIKPKHISILIEEFGINRSDCEGKSMEELYSFIEKKIQSFSFNPILDLAGQLSTIYTKLNTAYILKQTPHFTTGSDFTSLDIEILNNQKLAFLKEMSTYFRDEEEGEFFIEPFRRIFLENDDNGQITVKSSPWECTHETVSNKLRQGYGHLKFKHLSSFIDNNQLK